MLRGCPTVQKLTWFLHVSPVGSQQASLPVCALATELFLQVQKSLLHCSAAQPYNQALFLFWGIGAKGTPRAPIVASPVSPAAKKKTCGILLLSLLHLSSSFPPSASFLLNLPVIFPFCPDFHRPHVPTSPTSPASTLEQIYISGLGFWKCWLPCHWILRTSFESGIPFTRGFLEGHL